MKRTASILLLLLLIFNWIGYRLVSDVLQIQSDSKLEAKLDRNEYDESQLTEIRVPLNMPYYVGSTSFERFDGEIQINGIPYKYVKRKVENGELVLLCILNHEKTLIQSARADFFEIINDLQSNSNGKNSNDANPLAKSLLSEYCQQVNNWTLASFIPAGSNHYIFNSSLHSSKHVFIPEQPPEC